MTTKDPKQFVERVRSYCDKATPGEWVIAVGSGICRCTGIFQERCDGSPKPLICDVEPDWVLDSSHEHKDIERARIGNLFFISNSRTDLPAACDIIERQAAEIERLKEYNEHLIENGGRCDRMHEPDVGICMCVLCYPDYYGEEP